MEGETSMNPPHDQSTDQTTHAGRSGSLARVREALTRGRAIAELHARIDALEAEIQETRRLHRRVAELTDIVEELLVPVAQRDEAKLRETLEKYSTSW